VCVCVCVCAQFCTFLTLGLQRDRGREGREAGTKGGYRGGREKNMEEIAMSSTHVRSKSQFTMPFWHSRISTSCFKSDFVEGIFCNIFWSRQKEAAPQCSLRCRHKACPQDAPVLPACVGDIVNNLRNCVCPLPFLSRSDRK